VVQIMKAVVIPGVNGVWELRDLPIPRPGPGEVLIRVHACGICSNDVWTTQGVIPFPELDPMIPGHEPAGEIVEVGPGVTGRRVGDRVGTTWVQAGCGRCDYCSRNHPVSGQVALNCPAAVETGFTVPGGHAEYMTALADATVVIPDGVSYEQAAPMFCAGYTAWCALRQAEPKPHERVAVLGIGGLGHLAVQFSRACGFETVAITRSPDKHSPARTLGADLVVSDGEELLDAGGADVILVTGSSYRAASDALTGLRPEGRMVLAGIDPAEPFTLPPDSPFFGQRQRIIGSTHNGLHLLTECLNLVAGGAVRPVIETFPKERVADAVDKVSKGEVRFRAVISY
jgi:D-arabinose 1-dehydrogenase-like Zn-dependent alcohol dehydrogenase